MEAAHIDRLMEIIFLWVGIGFVVGAALGSFVKVLADRSLAKKSFLGRSYCTGCKKLLPWYDLLPIASFVLLKGKCRYCREKIGTEYLLAEITLGFLIGFLFWQNIPNFQSLDFKFLLILLDLIFKIFVIITLSVLFITDIKKMFIPDRISLPAIWISLSFLIVTTIFKIWYLYYYLSQTEVGKLLLPPHSEYFSRHSWMIIEPLAGSILMGLAISGFFTLLIIITKGKGMGGGDVKLGALIGLCLGFPLSLVALMFSFLSGALVSLFLITLGKKHFGQVIPFGPFLVLGTFITLFWGNQILDWYLTLGT